MHFSASYTASKLPSQYDLSSVNVPSDCLIVIKYPVIGEPLGFGAYQVKITLSFSTEVEGGVG